MGCKHYQLRPGGSDARGQQAQLFKQVKIAAAAQLDCSTLKPPSPKRACTGRLTWSSRNPHAQFLGS